MLAHPMMSTFPPRPLVSRRPLSISREVPASRAPNGMDVAIGSAPHPALSSFATVAELVEALREFRRRYNEESLIGRHGFRTPSQVRYALSGTSEGLDAGPLCRRVG